jgi:chemotaxis protein methyltransferase CheR
MSGYLANVPPMTESERRSISVYIENEFGIRMPAAKKSLLEGRLAKRVMACGLENYGVYFDFVTKDLAGRDEYVHFMDLVSTHETSFFREVRHFDFLRRSVLPALCKEGNRRSISVLCAACSTGEEAYTLGMLIDSSLREQRRYDIGFSVEGIDLSTKAVLIAERGVYLTERIKKIPNELRKRYVMVSKDKTKDLCRFVPELRGNMRFHTGNLLGDLALLHHLYDIVFCRNVLIYFDRLNQRRAIATLLSHMNPDSFLFLGHSETMLSFDFPLRSVAHSVYIKK